MRLALSLLTVLGLSAPAALAAQDCRSSPGGAYSFSVAVSPRAGRMALYDVSVFRGAACDAGALVGVAELGSYRRLAVTDGGTLVSILVPRTSHRDWNILRLLVVGPARRDVWLSLDELPGTTGLSGTVGASFDDGGVVFAGRSGDAAVPFAVLDGLASGG